MSSNIEEVLRKTVPGFLPDRDCAPVGSMHGIWNHAGILAVTNLIHICHTITYLFGYIGDSSSFQGNDQMIKIDGDGFAILMTV